MSECLHLFNLLLVRLNVAMSLSSVYEISSELLIAMYRSVSADTEPSVAADPREAIEYILGSLEKLLDSKLDHIHVDQLLDKDEISLSNLAEIYLGLLDLIEESQDARDKSDSTNELCLIDDKTDSDPLFESSMPFSPIPDTTNTSGPFRTKFPAVLNSSYSGSEIDHDMIEWVPGNQEVRDSSRSGPSEGTVRTNSQSLGKAIERRANEIKPIKVTTRTEETDLVWSRDKPSITSLSTANTADLIKSVESVKTEEIEKNLQNLELSAIEPAAGSPNSTLKAEEIIPQENTTVEKAETTTSTNKLINTLNVIEAEMAHDETDKIDTKSETNISDQSIKNLIKAIHQTVDESKAAREKLALEAQKVEKSKKSRKSKQFNPKVEMAKLIEKEDELRQEKLKMIESEYEAQLAEMRQKIDKKPAKSEAIKINEKSVKVIQKPVPAPSAGPTKKPTNSPKKKKPTGQMKTIQKPALEIGEAELLAAIIDEMPGIDHDQRTLKMLHDRQDKHLKLLDKEAREYRDKVRQKDAKVAEIRERQRLMARIAEKDEATKKRLTEMKGKQEQEKRLQKEMESRRHKNAKIKKYFADYQHGFKKSLKRKKLQEEKMLKQIFEEGLNIQKTRLRELRAQAQEMRAAENERRENELQSIENFYKDKFDMLAESLKSQQALVKQQEKENQRTRQAAKAELTKRLEHELRDMQDCILRENESMFYRDLEQERLLKEIRLAKFKSKLTKEL